MYTVYWEFVEKARRFVQERGNSLFDHGSMGNAVVRIWKKYGIVPAESYTGMMPGQKFHDHSKMVKEIQAYLNFIKTNNIWNEGEVLGNVKSILNHYMGEPPLKIIVKNEELSPLEYLDNHVKLDLNNYVDLLSLKQLPYHQYVEHPVPDNWWHNAHYYNLPLDDFNAVVSRSLSMGYTVLLGGDVSEAGYDAYTEVGMVPTFDIPSAYIDEDARQFRFSNKSTTDDHGIHAVGFMKMNGDFWYLIKDSGSGAQNGPNKGYRFYHQDYVKLKILDLMVHKDVVQNLIPH
jgi:bleomycin hydrolase